MKIVTRLQICNLYVFPEISIVASFSARMGRLTDLLTRYRGSQSGSNLDLNLRRPSKL